MVTTVELLTNGLVLNFNNFDGIGLAEEFLWGMRKGRVT